MTAVLALFDQLFDDGGDRLRRIVEFDTFVDFPLFHGGEQESDGSKMAVSSLALRADFHVFDDAFSGSWRSFWRLKKKSRRLCRAGSSCCWAGLDQYSLGGRVMLRIRL